MATAVNMPQVGQDLETAKILEWHVKVGDEVKKGDIIATVESDKASFEVEAFESGVVIELLFEEGDDGEVFKPIAYLGASGEKAPSAGQPDAEEKVEKQIEETVTVQQEIAHSAGVKGNGKIFSSPSARRVINENGLNIEDIPASGPNNRVIKRDVVAYLEANGDSKVRISPLAKKIAEDKGIDVSTIKGTGHEGKIIKQDVLRESAPVSPSSIEDQVVPFSKMRKIIADRLSISKQTIPHYYLFVDVDVTDTLAWRKDTNSKLGTKISVNDILIKAVANTLKEFPNMNSHVDSEKMIIKSDINIGVAVAIEDGLLVPVLPKANEKNLGEISAASKKLVEDAKRGMINPANVGTFTISNLGMMGVNRFFAIINPPECAILSVGSVEQKVVPVNGGILVRDILGLGLACDHRAVDGAYAGQFLSKLKENIEKFSI